MAVARAHDRSRLPPVVRVLLAASFVSDLGSGLTLPFLLIYLHEVRHIGLGVTGLLIGSLGVIALPVGAGTGSLVDRLGVRAIAVLALGLMALGTAALILVHGTTSALVPMALFGVGSGMSWPAWFALLSFVAHDEGSRPRLFALNFQLLNLGLGIGALVGGLVVRVADPGSFVAVYLGDAATTLFVAVVLAVMPARAFAAEAKAVEAESATAKVVGASLGQASGGGAPGPPSESLQEDEAPSRRQAERGEKTPAGGYRQVFSDRRMRRFLVSTTLLALAGYGAINAGLVGFATTVVHVTPRTVSLAFAANTAFIVAAQPFGLRLVHRMRRTTALSLVAAFFAAAWVMLGAAALWPRSRLGDALTIAMFVVFGAGEILLSPVQGPLVNELAPAELRGRYNAAATTVYSLASVISPAVAGIMLGASLGPEYLALLVACCVASVISFGWLRRALSPREDQAPS